MKTRAVLFAATLAVASPLGAAGQLAPEMQTKVAVVVQTVLRTTGVPSASVGIVRGGKVYVQAFGEARISPRLAATADMAYPIGSISKQFTAAAVLLLQEQGKLSIDDPVAKYFPELTRARDVTLRNLLTMTSGYEDFAPQDYSIPAWYAARDPAVTVKQWAGKPLDFEPGTRWQYSNTNYVLLGLIIEKVSGEPFDQFLRGHVLDAAHLTGAFDAYTDRDKLRTTGYISYALQPPRALPLEAAGWYFAAGELAMPVATLLAWDRTFIDKSLLSAASYKAMETPFVTKDGRDAGYGFGVGVHSRNGHPQIVHSGEVGGYVAENMVYPDDGVAIAVLTNEVASSAAGEIAAQIGALLLPATVTEDTAPDAVADALPGILVNFGRGQIDRALFTANCNAYFSADAVADYKATLAPLGAVMSIFRTDHALRGGMTFGAYRVVFANGATLLMNTYILPNGKLEQMLITGKE